MKFGKEFKTHLEETLPEWKDKFLSYKSLKKLLNNIPSASATGDQVPAPAPDWFVDILTKELEKFNDFYVDKEEDFIIRLQELKGRIEQLREQRTTNGVFTSKAEFSEEMMDIRKDFVSIHGEMVLLKNYSSLNFAGLIKILKKYDKRTGGLLQLPFTQLVLDQPFFTTEPLTRLVHECEANLELLFPLEEEVVQCTNDKDRPSDTSSPHREDTTDIYKSTLAAMKTIQGLRKASSTHNPLSFASIFGKQDSESTGAVTAENSPSDTFQNGQEANIGTTDSPD